MTVRERWQQVEELFAWGLERDPSTRAAEIARRCVGDADLCREVESLLHAWGSSADFLESPVSERIAAAGDEIEARVGMRIGRYRIVRRIGRGGMGVVYEALQDDPRRAVALKIVRGGALADAQHVRRFRREAESLARLDHPGIARILEAGVDEKSGEHWFAMELVHGLPLTDHVRATEPTRAARLDLFVRICRAVDHAHRQGVVHRDLKPSNLLVTEGAEAGIKVLDFGLAQCSAPAGTTATRLTEPGRVFGTLPYMSPEQAHGRTPLIGPATDVYSLGVVLYEMLTGRLPLDVDSVLLPEAVRRISESEPDRPSRFDRSLRGDLETILFKALEKDPARRYASAAALADDVERHALGEAIVARAPSFLYQSKKLVLRHRLFFGSAALVFVLLAVAATVASILFARARAAEQRALVQADTATEISGFLQELLAAAEPGRNASHELSVREVLDRAARRLDGEFQDRPQVAGELHATIGDAYRGVGDFDRAAEHLERSLTLLRGAHGSDAGVARALTGLGRVHFLQGRYAEAEAEWREALVLERRVGASVPLVETLTHLAGGVRQRSGSNAAFVEARALYEEALAITRAEPALDRNLEANVQNELGGLLSARGEYSLAEQYLRAALVHHQQRFGANDLRVAQDENDLAVLLSRTDRLDEAITLVRHACTTCSAILGPVHPTTLAMTNTLGSFLVRAGGLAEGEALLTEVLEGRRRALGESHPDVANTLNQLGHAARRRGDPVRARQYFEEALAKNRARLGEMHVEVGNGLASLACVEVDVGDTCAALPHARAALAVYAHVLTPDQAVRQRFAGFLGQILSDAGEWSEAEPLLVESFASLERTHAPGDPALAQASARLARLYEATARPDEARRVRERVTHVGAQVGHAAR